MQAPDDQTKKRTPDLRGSLKDSLYKTRSSDPTNLASSNKQTPTKAQAVNSSINKLYDNIQKEFLRKSQDLQTSQDNRHEKEDEKSLNYASENLGGQSKQNILNFKFDKKSSDQTNERSLKAEGVSLREESKVPQIFQGEL